MVFTIKQAIYMFFKNNPGRFFYYSDIVAGANRELIKRHISPKRSSTIDRKIRELSQKEALVVSTEGFLVKI